MSESSTAWKGFAGRLLFGTAVTLAILCTTGAAHAQQTIFLEFQPAIQGESTAIGFTNQIDVMNATLAAKNPACTGGKGMSDFSEVVFTKLADRASVDMMAALDSHQVFTLVKFRFVRLGVVYQEFQLENAVLSSTSVAGVQNDARNYESWSLSFSRATIVYTYIDSKGAPAGTESVSILPAACVGN